MVEKEMCMHAKEDAEKAMEMAQSKFREAKEQVKDVIKKDPVNAAMVATGIGFVAGLALAWAVMSKKHRYSEA